MKRRREKVQKILPRLRNLVKEGTRYSNNECFSLMRGNVEEIPPDLLVSFLESLTPKFPGKWTPLEMEKTSCSNMLVIYRSVIMISMACARGDLNFSDHRDMLVGVAKIVEDFLGSKRVHVVEKNLRSHSLAFYGDHSRNLSTFFDGREEYRMSLSFVKKRIEVNEKFPTECFPYTSVSDILRSQTELYIEEAELHLVLGEVEECKSLLLRIVVPEQLSFSDRSDLEGRIARLCGDCGELDELYVHYIRCVYFLMKVPKHQLQLGRHEAYLIARAECFLKFMLYDPFRVEMKRLYTVMDRRKDKKYLKEKIGILQKKMNIVAEKIRSEVVYGKRNQMVVRPKMFKDEVCSNLTCLNSKLSGSALMKCSACKEVMYCSRKCQSNDWKFHKPICEETVGLINFDVV